MSISKNILKKYYSGKFLTSANDMEIASSNHLSSSTVCETQDFQQAPPAAMGEDDPKPSSTGDISYCVPQGFNGCSRTILIKNPKQQKNDGRGWMS